MSDNFYLRGTEEGNYQALRQLPKVEFTPSIQTQKGTDGTWTATVALENKSNTPALLRKGGEKDGYFTLNPETTIFGCSPRMSASAQ